MKVELPTEWRVDGGGKVDVNFTLPERVFSRVRGWDGFWFGFWLGPAIVIAAVILR